MNAVDENEKDGLAGREEAGLSVDGGVMREVMAAAAARASAAGSEEEVAGWKPRGLAGRSAEEEVSRSGEGGREDVRGLLEV